MRPTLKDTYRNRVKQHTNNKEQLNSKEYENALKLSVRLTVHSQLNKDSKQLGTSPPKIAEQTLQRNARSQLAQLVTAPAKLLLEKDLRQC